MSAGPAKPGPLEPSAGTTLLSYGRNRATGRGTGALVCGDAGAYVRPCRLQRSQAGGGRRAAPEGARRPVPACAAVAAGAGGSPSHARRPGARRSRSRPDRNGTAGGRAEAGAGGGRSRRPKGRADRGSPGSGGRRGGTVGRRRLPDADAVRRTAWVLDRAAVVEPE